MTSILQMVNIDEHNQILTILPSNIETMATACQLQELSARVVTKQRLEYLILVPNISLNILLEYSS